MDARAALVETVGDPGAQVVAAVENAPGEAEATRSGVAVAPEAQGGDRGAQQFGGFGDGEQLGFGGVVGHGWLQGRVGCRRPCTYRRRRFGPFADTPEPTSAVLLQSPSVP